MIQNISPHSPRQFCWPQASQHVFRPSFWCLLSHGLRMCKALLGQPFWDPQCWPCWACRCLRLWSPTLTVFGRTICFFLHFLLEDIGLRHRFLFYMYIYIQYIHIFQIHFYLYREENIWMFMWEKCMLKILIDVWVNLWILHYCRFSSAMLSGFRISYILYHFVHVLWSNLFRRNTPENGKSHSGVTGGCEPYFGGSCWKCFSIIHPWKMVVGRLLSFWEGLYLGAMLNFRGV